MRTALTLLLTVAAGFGFGSSARADDYATDWGPAIGSELPILEAPDQTGAVRTLADLAGKQGLLLFLVRSADW